MAYCLPKFAADALKGKFKSGEVTPQKLIDMTSAERRELFSFLGVENAKHVNALFESKLLLKNQQQGIVNWAKSVTGMKPEVLRDTLSKVEKMTEVLQPQDLENFLQDLAEKRLGVGVSVEEAGKLVDLAKDIEVKKAKIPENSPIGSKERLEYGLSLTLFKDYVSELKIGSEKLTLKEYLQNPKKAVLDFAGVTKSILSSLDNSFFGRQGLKMLFTNPDIWMKNFLKSWGDIGKELKGADAIIPIKSDVFSRPNALNGKYKNMELAIGLSTEEAFPSSLPTRIPGLGRLFKASESAYNGAALRMRADLADRIIVKAERAGVDTTDPMQMKSLGKLVNSMTGRGNIGRVEAIGQEVNALAFSIKFLKSNIDTLTAHQFDSTMSRFAKRQAAMNLVKIVGTTAGIMGLANVLFPGSVDFDPRSSNFGKIKIGNTRFDITGGMGSLVTLASRVVPTYHNGKFGWWYKSGNKFKQLSTGKYGSLTPMDFIYSFGEGKFSPVAGNIVDLLRQETFEGTKPSVASTAKNLLVPLPVTTYFELKDPKAAPMLLSIILNELGIGVSNYK